MAKSNKPTNKDRDQAINALMSNVSWLRNQFELLGRLFDSYIAFKDDTDKFMAYIDKIKKEYEEKQKEANDEAEDNAKPDAEPSEASPENAG